MSSLFQVLDGLRSKISSYSTAAPLANLRCPKTMPVPVKVRALFVSARLTRRKAGGNVDGETNGGQEATQGAQDQAQQQDKEQQET